MFMLRIARFSLFFMEVNTLIILPEYFTKKIHVQRFHREKKHEIKEVKSKLFMSKDETVALCQHRLLG